MKSKLYIIVTLALIFLTGGCINTAGWNSDDGRKLVILQESLPDTLDPLKNSSYENVLPLTGIYEGLVKLNTATLTPEPCLARNWEVSGDGLRWTFNLFPGIKFSDGTPCTAEAVRASMARSLSLKDTDPYPALVFAPVASIDTSGEYTVSFTLKDPFTPFIKNLALPFAAPVVSPAALLKYGDNFWKYPSGTGPYMVDSLGRNKIELRPNPYYRAGPASSNIIFKAVPDPIDRSDQLLSGKADIIFFPASRSLDALRSKNMKVISLPGLDLSFIGFYTDRAPFSDRDLRRAIAGSLDRGKIVAAAMEGEGVPADGILPPPMAGPGMSKGPSYTTGQVREILSRKGYPGGMDITLVTYQDSRRYCPQGGSALAEEIKRQLESLGIRVKIAASPWDRHKESILNRDGDFFLYGWTCDNGDPDNFMHTLFHSTQLSSGLNVSGFTSQKLDVYLLTARRVADGKARKTLYEEAESIILQEAPLIPLNHSLTRIAAAPGVKGINLSGFGLIELNTIQKD
ncbi:MAG: hypothetical protein JL50_12360 [Peptococcaceae bacterium BICA1-7]|nr:MAG: hypothetical protein JL50_12360 [Peptococcaceae bacterium BICA1-7]